MANPTKAKDPAEAALSAVEEALKLDFGGPETSASFNLRPRQSGAGGTRARGPQADSKGARTSVRSARRAGAAVADARPQPMTTGATSATSSTPCSAGPPLPPSGALWP